MPLSGQIEFASFPVIGGLAASPRCNAFLRYNSFKWKYFETENMIFLVKFFNQKSPAVLQRGF